MNDASYMQIALKEAEKAKANSEVPVGAIIVHNRKIIGKGYNQTITLSDPTAHAEITAIKQASNFLANHRIVDSEIYVTLEPCSMCYGAIIQSRISRIIFGAYDSNTGVCGSCLKLQDEDCFNHRPNIIGGVLGANCSKILKDFFKAKRT